MAEKATSAVQHDKQILTRSELLVDWGGTKAGSNPFSANTALTLAILDDNVANVPTRVSHFYRGDGKLNVL